MDNLMNTNRALAYPVILPYLEGNLPCLLINIPTFHEVMETLDVFSEVIVRGRVVDQMGLPVAGALVEMWHPELWGAYNMEYGPSFAPIDPDGQGWACCISDENGEYFFKTEKRTNQLGLPFTSIDLKVTDENAEVVLSKLYFDENVLDPADPFLMAMEIEERYQYFGHETNGVCEFDILF